MGPKTSQYYRRALKFQRGPAIIGWMKKKSIIFLLAQLAFWLSAKTALAVCPVCTAGVIVGLGLSRWLHIDDTISGIWIGGLLLSISLMTANWLTKKNVNFPGRTALLIIFFYALTIWPLYSLDIIGHPKNVLFGIDKLILGIAVGSVFFYGGVLLYETYKKKHGKALFPFQKIVMPIGPLIILSIVFFFLTK